MENKVFDAWKALVDKMAWHAKGSDGTTQSQVLKHMVKEWSETINEVALKNDGTEIIISPFSTIKYENGTLFYNGSVFSPGLDDKGQPRTYGAFKIPINPTFHIIVMLSAKLKKRLCSMIPITLASLEVCEYEPIEGSSVNFNLIAS